MPIRAMKECLTRGCGKLVARGYCAECEGKGKGRDTRPSAAARLYGHAWRIASKGFLRKHPLCSGVRNAAGIQLTTHDGQIVPATEVDHIRPHREDPALFWDRDNWQGACKPCHSHKTATEDGGLGRRGMGRG